MSNKPWKAEEKPYVFKGNFFFQFFCSQEITKLRKYYTRFSLAKVDDQPVAERLVRDTSWWANKMIEQKELF